MLFPLSLSSATADKLASQPISHRYFEPCHLIADSHSFLGLITSVTACRFITSLLQYDLAISSGLTVFHCYPRVSPIVNSAYHVCFWSGIWEIPCTEWCYRTMANRTVGVEPTLAPTVLVTELTVRTRHYALQNPATM